jgi:ABC-type lipoprotein export system ATPase subunit
MENNNIYNIGKLVCSYFDKVKKEPVEVLVAEDLEISREEITVILGPSGSGKSTFMEAISLMSDTLKKGDGGSKDIFFYPDIISEPIDILKFEKRSKRLEELRLENFSFIFQNTNIMGNFTPVENVALPKMLKSDKNDPDGKKIESLAKMILKDSLNLQIDLSKPGTEYSGGQKQRFAFARAFMAQGKVLFGDEPTGNLDKYNAETLFWFIKRNILGKEKDKKVGAIIVTHNIELALKFADRIIVIVKPERNTDIQAIKKDDGKEQKKGQGYTNPYFVYHNCKDRKWRNDDKDKIVNENIEKEYLPPVFDDGSDRFDFNKKLKIKMEKEIIFYLNNSYAFAQKWLVEFAKKLNDKIKLVLNNEKLSNVEKSLKVNELKVFFEKLKVTLINNVDNTALKRLTIFLNYTGLKDYMNNSEIAHDDLYKEIFSEIEDELDKWLKEYIKSKTETFSIC